MASSAPSTLRNDAIAILAARSVRIAAQVVLLVLVSRVEGAAAAADLAVSITVSSPIFITAEMGLRTVYITLRPKVAFPAVLRARYVSLATASIAAFSLSAALTGDPTIAALVTAIKLIESIGEVCYGPAQRYLETVRMSAWLTLAPLIASAFSLGGAVWLGTAEVVIGLYAVGLLLPVGLGALRHARALTREETWFSPLSTLVHAGIPLGFSASLTSLTMAIPQAVLSQFRPADEVLTFSLILYIYTATEMVQNALSQAWIPRLAAYRDSNSLGKSLMLARKRFRSVVALGILGAGASISLGLGFGPALLGISRMVSPVLIATLAVGTMLIPLVFTSMAYMNVECMFRHSLLISICGVVVTIGIATGIPAYGLTVAAVSPATVMAWRGVASTALLWRRLRRER